MSAQAPQPQLPALPARTHAVLQWDVGAQPDVIQGELSRVAAAYKSLKHYLWEIKTEMSVSSWDTGSGSSFRGKGQEICSWPSLRTCGELRPVLLPSPASATPVLGKAALQGWVCREIATCPGSTQLAICSIKCLSRGMKAQ